MRSIVYAGHDFSRYCSAEVVERGVHVLAADSLAMPGRAGTLPLPAYVPPEDVRVRLMLDCGYSPGSRDLSRIRHEMRSWLCQPACAALVLPDDPSLEYRDVLLTGAAAWSSLFEIGECIVTFTLFDPVAYGAQRVERTYSFEVGGTWPTYPEFRMVAAEGDAVQVACPALGQGVRIEQTFAGGETVVVDCEAETVLVNDADARDIVTLGSDFFALRPGACTLTYSGCTYGEARFRERWA